MQPPPPPPVSPSPPYGQPPPPYGQPPYGFAQPYGCVQPPARRRRRWWLWGCGGCAVLVLILFAIGAAVGITRFTGSPLRLFPVESGARQVSDNFQVVNGQSSEVLVIDDPHSLTDVETFYQGALNTGGWTVDSADPSQASSGDVWHFGRSGASTQAGSITFITIRGITEVMVDYVS
jgi:hypothetical protein